MCARPLQCTFVNRGVVPPITNVVAAGRPVAFLPMLSVVFVASTRLSIAFSTAWTRALPSFDGAIGIARAFPFFAFFDLSKAFSDNAFAQSVVAST